MGIGVNDSTETGGEPKVGDFGESRVSVLDDKNIFRLQVAVDDFVLVEVLHRTEKLDEYPRGLIFGEHLLSADVLEQVSSVRELEHDVPALGVLVALNH